MSKHKKTKYREENKKCRVLLDYALDCFYVFEDDQIEDKIDLAQQRFPKRKRLFVKNWILSDSKIREKILNLVEAMGITYENRIINLG